MAETLRKSGTVAVGPAEFVVEELSVEAEIGLLNHLRRRAREALGPGSFYANSLPVADWLRAQGKGGEAAALLAETARLVAVGASPDDAAVWAYLDTPDGIADEIYRRTRRTQPGATRDEIRAVVNDANAAEVRVGVTEALAAKKVPAPSA